MAPFRVRSFTGMCLITGMDYQNGHLSLAFSTLNAYCMYKNYGIQ